MLNITHTHGGNMIYAVKMVPGVKTIIKSITVPLKQVLELLLQQEKKITCLVVYTRSKL